MIESRKEVKNYVVDAFCECAGEMTFTGLIKTSNPPLFQHKCNTCGKIEDSHCRYPKMVYDYV